MPLSVVDHDVDVAIRVDVRAGHVDDALAVAQTLDPGLVLAVCPGGHESVLGDVALEGVLDRQGLSRGDGVVLPGEI